MMPVNYLNNLSAYWQRKATKDIRDSHPEIVILSEGMDAGNGLAIMVKDASTSIRLGANDDWLGQFNTYLAGLS